MNIYDTHEGIRLRMNQQDIGHWNRWGPFVADRAWGTVREDYQRRWRRVDLFSARSCTVAGVSLE